MQGREAAGMNSLPEPCPQAGGQREAGVEIEGMRTQPGEAVNSDHVYLPTEPYPEGRGLRGRRKGRVRFVRLEELGAPSPLHLTGPHRHCWEVPCMAKECARMLPIKSSEVPPAPTMLHCQPRSPALPGDALQRGKTIALHEGCEMQPEQHLHGPGRCSHSPHTREGWAGPIPPPSNAGQQEQMGWEGAMHHRRAEPSSQSLAWGHRLH